MTENETVEKFENEVVILDCLIENEKDIIANCDTEDDEFDDDKELAELSLKDYSERKELFETVISALEEIQQYRKIGAVEECREAVEKQKAKSPETYTETVQTVTGCFEVDVFECPVCGSYICNVGDELPNYCDNCGQKLGESEGE